MANVTFKKRLGVIFFILIFTFDSFTQNKNKISEFSDEFPIFLTELKVFMTASDNDNLKSVYKRFSKDSKSFSKDEMKEIIKISNVMLSKKHKVKPHFLEFLSSITSINNSLNGNTLLNEWLNVMNEIVKYSSSKKIMLFCAFSNDLVTSNIIRNSKSAKWNFSNTDFHFKIESFEPVIIFDTPFDLICSLKTIYNIA